MKQKTNENIFGIWKTNKHFEKLKSIILKSDFKNKFQFIEQTRKELSKLYFPDTLPQGMIHEDLGKRHILWKNNKISCVIDFDRCYYGKLILDLAQAIRGWCFTNNWKQWNNENFETLMKGYISEREITPIEKKYLFDAVKFAVIERGLSFAQRYIQITRNAEDENFAQHSISENGLLGILENKKIHLIF
jgi:Ser/Thr protein kinase RdoA (MazF antagonist)